jgi:uncharacterized membrane protein
VSVQFNKFLHWMVHSGWHLVAVGLLVIGIVVGSVVYSYTHTLPGGTDYVYVPEYDSDLW